MGRTTAVWFRWGLSLGILALMSACDAPIGVADRQPASYQVDETKIVLGSSLALGGHAGYLGTQTLHGALAYIHHVNEQGGVHGRRIELIAYDDAYDPPRCVANTQKLIIQDGVFALFSYVGTPTTVKIVPLVEKARIPLVGMFTGAYALREPVNRYLVNVRASYYQETAAAVKHLAGDLGIRRLAVFYQYDAYGFDGLRGTELALRAYGLTPVARGSYIRGTLHVEEGLERIRESGAEAVVMIGTYEPCARFIREARAAGFNPVFYNVSFVGADELARRLGPDGDGVMVSQVVPPPESAEMQALLPGVSDYVRLLSRFYPDDKPNFVSLEGYINARVLVEGLERAGRGVDRESFIDAIETIRDWDIGIANTISFSPADHQGLEEVYFTCIKNEAFFLITDWKAVGFLKPALPK